jgi:hypothetical protein
MTLFLVLKVHPRDVNDANHLKLAEKWHTKFSLSLKRNAKMGKLSSIWHPIALPNIVRNTKDAVVSLRQ